MSIFIQVTLNGLAIGSTYALLALALVVIWKSTGVLNFAQGEIGLFGAFVTWQVLFTFDANYYVAILAGIAGAAALAVVIERTVIRPILSESHFALLVMAIGLYIGVNALTRLLWTQESRSIEAPFVGAFQIGNQFISKGQVVAIGSGLAIVIGLSLFFRTAWGIRIRAIAEDRTTPRLLGVRIGVIYSLSWALGTAISVIAIVLYTQSTVLSQDQALFLIIPATVAGTVGGFSSVTGCFVGGLLLGLVENYVAYYISSSAKSAVALLVVVVILMIKREGIFGSLVAREI